MEWKGLQGACRALLVGVPEGMLSGPSCVCAGSFWASGQRRSGQEPVQGPKKNPACLSRIFPTLQGAFADRVGEHPSTHAFGP